MDLFKSSPTYYVVSYDYKHSYIGKWFRLDQPCAKRIIESLNINFDDLLLGTVSITDEQVRSLFDYQLAKTIEEAESLPNFLDHPQEVRQVIIEMIFCISFEDFQKMTAVVNALNRRDYKKLTKAILESSWSLRSPYQADQGVSLVYKSCVS